MGGETQPASGSRQRIDKWLFFTRMVKSRSLAQSHVQSGHVRINGERAIQPSQTVKAGDRVELQLDRRDVVLLVKLPGERRGLSKRRSAFTRTSRRLKMRRNVSPPTSKRSAARGQDGRQRKSGGQSTGSSRARIRKLCLRHRFLKMDNP